MLSKDLIKLENVRRLSRNLYFLNLYRNKVVSFSKWGFNNEVWFLWEVQIEGILTGEYDSDFSGLRTE